MIRQTLLAVVCAAGVYTSLPGEAQAQPPVVAPYSVQDWDRFYHYPYVYYPQNFWGPDYYESADHLYFRYPPEMRIPVYNRRWHNEYPQSRRFHWGHHFVLDTF